MSLLRLPSDFLAISLVNNKPHATAGAFVFLLLASEDIIEV